MRVLDHVRGSYRADVMALIKSFAKTLLLSRRYEWPGIARTFRIRVRTAHLEEHPGSDALHGHLPRVSHGLEQMSALEESKAGPLRKTQPATPIRHRWVCVTEDASQGTRGAG